MYFSAKNIMWLMRTYGFHEHRLMQVTALLKHWSLHKFFNVVYFILFEIQA